MVCVKPLRQVSDDHSGNDAGLRFVWSLAEELTAAKFGRRLPDGTAHLECVEEP